MGKEREGGKEERKTEGKGKGKGDREGRRDVLGKEIERKRKSMWKGLGNEGEGKQGRKRKSRDLRR